MNGADKVAALEALLAKVQKNASAPRPGLAAARSAVAAPSPAAAPTSPVAAQKSTASAAKLETNELDIAFEGSPKPAPAKPAPAPAKPEPSPKPPVAAKIEPTPKPAAAAAKPEPSPKPPSATTRPSMPAVRPAARPVIAAPKAPTASPRSLLEDLDEPTRDHADEATVVRGPLLEDLSRTRVAEPRPEDLAQAQDKRLEVPTSSAQRGSTEKPAVESEPQSTTQVYTPAKPAAAAHAPEGSAKPAHPAAEGPRPVPAAPIAPFRRTAKATLMGVGIADLEALQKQLEPKPEPVVEEEVALSESEEPTVAFAATSVIGAETSLGDASLAASSPVATVVDAAPPTEVLPSTLGAPSAPFGPAFPPIADVGKAPAFPPAAEPPFAATLASEGAPPELAPPAPAAVAPPPVASSPASPAENLWARPVPTTPPPKRKSRGTAWLLGIATALLVGAAVFVYLRQSEEPGAKPGPGPSAMPITSMGTAPTGVTPSATAPGSALAAPPAPAAPTASAGVAASAQASAGSAAIPAAPPGDTSSLLASEGLLTVESSASAGVYLNGKYSGVTNQPLKVPCGTRFVRLAPLSDPPKPSPASWVSPGGAVIVPCKAALTAKVEPGPSPPPGPAPTPGGGTPYP